MAYIVIYKYIGADKRFLRTYHNFDWKIYSAAYSKEDAYNYLLASNLEVPSDYAGFKFEDLRHNFKVIDVLEITERGKERFIDNYFFKGGKKKNYEDFIRELDLERGTAS